jgi:hypothetical protein
MQVKAQPAEATDTVTKPSGRDSNHKWTPETQHAGAADNRYTQVPHGISDTTTTTATSTADQNTDAATDQQHREPPNANESNKRLTVPHCVFFIRKPDPAAACPIYLPRFPRWWWMVVAANGG